MLLWTYEVYLNALKRIFDLLICFEKKTDVEMELTFFKRIFFLK